MISRLTLISGLLLLMFIFSCKKDNTRYNYSNGIDGARSFVTAQQMMTLLLNTYFKSLTDSTLLADKMSKIDGAEVFFHTNPERFYFKYPYWGADDGFGHWRINPYEAIARTSFDDPGVIVDFVFHDFLYEKDTLIVNDLVVTYLGEQDGENDYFSVTSGSIERIYTDTTGVLSFTLDQTFIRHKDPSTIYTSDEDYFEISGLLTGTSKNKNSFQATIKNDSVIILHHTCAWLKQGIPAVSIERFNFPAYVYFPDRDTCMNQFIVTVDTNPFQYPID